MELCPNCQTKVEPFEVHCHQCGKVLSLAAVPVVDDVPVPSRELEEAYRNWLDKGEDAFKQGRCEEAAACLHEALKRARALEKATEHEICVRRKLAEVLEKNDKLAEAAEQYAALSGMAANDNEGRDYLDKARKLDEQADLFIQAADFQPVSAEEARFAPLYCSNCKRLVSEAEAYAFRKARGGVVRCLCGSEQPPLTRHDRKYQQAIKEAQKVQGRKAKLLEAASAPCPGGKRRLIACLLAVLLGNFGAHKFYLGERDAGFVYLLFCWTLLPWLIALFEAVHYSQMSMVTFNLSYNVEQVIARIPAEPEAAPTPDVFSMEITEDPEDFVDEYTQPRIS